MSRYCIVDKKTGEITNEIAWDGQREFEVPDGSVVIESSDGSGVGGMYDFQQKKFIPPVPKN